MRFGFNRTTDSYFAALYKRRSKWYRGGIFLFCFLMLIACEKENDDKSYFHDLVMYYSDCEYIMQGTVINENHDKNIKITDVIAQDNTQIRITGNVKKINGEAAVLYISSNGTKTVIAEPGDETVDKKINIDKGGGSVKFEGLSDDFSYSFQLNFELNAKVSYSALSEKNSDNETEEETQEETVPLESLEEPPDLFAGDWDTGLRRVDQNFTATDLSILLQTDAPGTLKVDCNTEQGSLGMKICDVNGKIYFSEEVIATGHYEISLNDTVNTYLIILQAEKHTGSICFKLENR